MATALLPCTIPSGQSTSNAITVATGAVVGLMMPLAWDGAAIVTLEISLDSGTTWGTLFKPDGTIFGAPVVPGSVLLFDAPQMNLSCQLRIRSGHLSKPVAQKANRDFKFITV